MHGSGEPSHKITLTMFENLEPKALWANFATLNAVPRPSKKEERVIAFIKNFGERLGLPTKVDDTGNVLIKKPASPGMEARKPVVLQSHLDMVHQKNAGTDFNFDRQGIEMYVDGDWVKARGTTLGADNGIGVAAIMTLLASSDIPHPPLEALFTIDEETGMTGAMGLKGGLLSAPILLNLDTEDDRELTIGCAGGVDVSAYGHYPEEATPAGRKAMAISLKGLTGGHSGMDIHLGRANANKLMNRLLHGLSEKYGARIASIDGGGLRNAIPRESAATVVVQARHEQSIEKQLGQWAEIFLTEYKTTDPGLSLSWEKVPVPQKVMSRTFQKKLLQAVYACPNGIYRLSPDVEGLVQTSNNLARVLAQGGQYTLLCLTRSSVESEKADLAAAIVSALGLAGIRAGLSGGYPGWAPHPDAVIVQLMSNLYEEMFGEKPHVNACHAGLECGILGSHYPGMEMISFGPNIRGAHSPDEMVQISSVQKFWRFLLETLKRTP